MIAILGGFGAAVIFATATLCSSRSSRMIGASSVLAWVMIIGSLIIVPAVIAEGRPAGLDRGSDRSPPLGGRWREPRSQRGRDAGSDRGRDRARGCDTPGGR